MSLEYRQRPVFCFYDELFPARRLLLVALNTRPVSGSGQPIHKLFKTEDLMPSKTREKKVRQQTGLTHAEARTIARDAYIYGFPLVDSYRVQYAYFVDQKDPEYKGAWNQVHHTARVYTPEDKAVQTPNSDTPYSFVGADLRAEPLVFTVPEVEQGRYYALQFIDAYTFNFAYVGSRATGNGAGNYLLAGPAWKGEKQAGVKDVIRSETELVMVLYRTQLFRPEDIDNVKKIQAGYRVLPLSQFLGQPAPSVPPIAFAKPLTAKDQRSSLQFFNLLNLVLQFCPTHPSETELRERFALLGIGAGKTFEPGSFSLEMYQAIEDGIQDAWQAYQEERKKLATGALTSADVFGTREYLRNNYLRRMTAAVEGIYGNSKEEAYYPGYLIDYEGQQLDGTTNRYTLRFVPGQLPPVNAFWSLTLYQLPASLLYANPLNRYLINSPMLPDLKKDPDGGLTLYIQHESPGSEKEANWLPAPRGAFKMALRLYWPRAAAYDGSWEKPPLRRQP